MPSEQITDQIRRRINYEAFYQRFIQFTGPTNHDGWRPTRCVFHDDDEPSLSISMEHGGYRCFGCGATGDLFDFYQRVRSVNFPTAVREIAEALGIEVPNTEDETPSRESGYIDDDVPSAYHERLLATPSALEWLEEHRGITVDTVREFQLGHDGDRYYIPIRDETGRCVNIRRYKPNARRSQDKMISWRPGFGSARLWPQIEAFTRAANGEPIYLFEGEMDALLAIQIGLNGMTTTGGAGTWRDGWSPLFRGRDVIICYDVDEAGQTGARRIALKLAGVAERVRIVDIPLAEPEGADFTDYIHGHGHSREDFMRLVGQALDFVANADAEREAERAPREPHRLHLSQASHAEYHNEPIRVPVVVSGKTTAPYIVPKTIRASCSMPGQPMCAHCPVAEAAGVMTRAMEFGKNEVLQFIGVPDSTVEKQLKTKLGVPGKCRYVHLDPEESINVEEVHLIPEIDRTTQDAPYVTRVAYYMGHGLQANRGYLMTGLTVSDPRRQQVTHVIEQAVPAQSNIDAFRLTDEVVRRLRTFQPSEPGVNGLWAKLDEVYDELEGVTRIYQRRDLMLAVDLVFHSVLQFDIQHERTKRGWCEALIIGDSRTGKTTIVDRMVRHYGAGEITSGENTTIAGLVGGLHQLGNSWALQWGRMPLNDRRLIVIDEAGNLQQGDIGRMSSMRSEGVAQVVKVHTESTQARTRAIWISNPRGQKPLSAYSQGVLAVKELIGAPEDIARFDLVVTAASDDVALAMINRDRDEAPPDRYTSALCHQRVMWAWSREPEDVKWVNGAERRLLELATWQGEKYQYATGIPLVERNEQRVKLARLAVAAACLFFSSDEAGEQVIVKPEHVEFAASFLERLYRKRSLAFDEFAAIQMKRNEVTNVAEVEAIISRRAGAAQELMNQEHIIQRDLQEILGYDDRDELRAAISKLRESGFLDRQGTSYYYKTPGANRFLRARLGLNNGAGGGVSRFSDEAHDVSADLLPDQPPF